MTPTEHLIENEQKLEAENRVLADAIATLSGQLTASRDISQARLYALRAQIRRRKAAEERIAPLQDAHKAAKEWCASLKEANQRLREKSEKRLDEVKAAHSNADMWLGQVHQRDEVINSKNILIKQRDKRIEQGDEELRLLMCDIHPDGRARGYVGGAGHPPGQYGGGQAGGRIEHGGGGGASWSKADQLQNTVARLQQENHELKEETQRLMGRLAVNPWTQSKVEGLQHKNQEIGSKLGYYKMKTGDLRAALKVSESVIKVLQRERNEAHLAQDRAEDQRNRWKRKYHRFHARQGTTRIDLADPTVGSGEDKKSGWSK